LKTLKLKIYSQYKSLVNILKLNIIVKVIEIKNIDIENISTI